jgi:uncharacterized protein with HEPN domain
MLRPEDPDAAYLWDMLETARTVQGFIADVSYAAYLQDRMRQLAVERAIEIIGEAARHVSRSFRNAHPEIPWHPIIAQRHILAHEYGEIQQERIWRVATVHIPPLIAQLEPLIPSTP